MDIAKTGKKKTNQDLDEHKKNQYRLLKSIERNEKMVEEMHQQILQIERQIMKKEIVHEKAMSGLKRNLQYGWVYNEKWRPIEEEYFGTDCPKKMELDKLTFANNAYRDKKAIVSFSSGEREINIHNLNHRMLHEAHSMDGERRLLKVLNPNKDIDSGLSLKQVKEQMWITYGSMEYPNIISSSDRERIKRKLKEVEGERDRVFVNAPVKASLWNSLPSTKDLHKQIQALEAKDEEKRRMVLVRRKKIESKERKIKKAENEIMSLRKMMERFRIRKQRALGIISYEKSCLEKTTILSLVIE